MFLISLQRIGFHYAFFSSKNIPLYCDVTCVLLTPKSSLVLLSWSSICFHGVSPLSCCLIDIYKAFLKTDQFSRNRTDLNYLH